jgi:hypothetical protein
MFQCSVLSVSAWFNAMSGPRRASSRALLPLVLLHKYAHLPAPEPMPEEDDDEDDARRPGSGGGNIDPEEDEGWSDDENDDEETSASRYEDRGGRDVERAMRW